jgi:hypothetical protein
VWLLRLLLFAVQALHPQLVQYAKPTEIHGMDDSEVRDAPINACVHACVCMRVCVCVCVRYIGVG